MTCSCSSIFSESVIKGKKGTSKEIEAETAVAVVGEEEEEAVWSPHSATTTMRLDDSESDYSSLQSEDEGDGEGSLEDAIASLSSKVERTVFSATSPGPGPAPVSPSTAHGEEHLSEEGRDSSAPSLGSDAASKQKGESLSGLQNIDSLGAGLPINVREALRYRIRKKM